MTDTRVLIGSPIHQQHPILQEFLTALTEIKNTTFSIDYLFIDDNTDQQSIHLLREFSDHTPHQTKILKPSHMNHQGYARDENTHIWNHQAIWKVAAFKNRIIDYAIKEEYDYLFLIDSDLIIHPNTIKHLIQMEKNIISTIFWTKWQPNTNPLPQVWMKDEYTLYPSALGEQLSDEEKNRRSMEFINTLKNPGTYEVGGLGACTLIHANALKNGVNFNPIQNISFWGEDRHFCVRAQALGFQLFVDTHYPAFHIYRSSDLNEVQEYKDENTVRISPIEVNEILSNRTGKTKNNKLTLSMIMKNEASRYLERILKMHRNYIDEAVIIDDGSDDDSIAICQKLLEGIPLHLVQNHESTFSNEIELRKQQWEETIKTNPDWILNLDADELPEAAFTTEVTNLMNQSDMDLYSFRLYDMWDEENYREDKYWKSHQSYRPFLLRYQPHFDYKWQKKRLHCGRFPANIFHLPNTTSSLRIKHFGWADEEERAIKYKRYLQLDPKGEFGWLAQYHSILDKQPKLIKWEEDNTKH
ncbi:MULTISPECIES: glycosyltransferase family 2 protein [Virgibacillus]|uniref:Glycosyl transferase family 2 n=1 Tax=Virgibacillus massiliensis TaxID=1462526 RepID=A0A024QDR1_9BACI|nr:MULTISPECIES: glycosyltransferase family 2 protein [Virgibacillus]EQB36640.1 hypothetical protein M948_16545 [Virgibacillus sp. CM-4]MYL42474.1 glycosyltransferase [Virgibacillus massiliensis]CDQ40340.1 Glycosyl transferase family 2 [Virgibacillus massiliensis]